MHRPLRGSGDTDGRRPQLRSDHGRRVRSRHPAAAELGHRHSRAGGAAPARQPRRLLVGDYEDGAARLLALTGFHSDGTVTAFYAGAPRPGTDSKPFSRNVTARLEGDALVFRKSAGTRSFRALPDGTVTATWTPDSGKPLEMVVRRQR